MKVITFLIIIATFISGLMDEDCTAAVILSLLLMSEILERKVDKFDKQ